MSKKSIISPQIINTLAMSHEPKHYHLISVKNHRFIMKMEIVWELYITYGKRRTIH
ncbi:putative transcriptional regulator (partial) [Xenorhabdus nematophila F1]|uniref:Transcriptional regulator (Partial) n=1 Tax=Xenorhabdus nematophila (strain ATCC 19061 / DSM 3370 / CCUG 14189 / LMG 1036 / NCIMB 9965 / AN6) TaxID=406817 RepID=D3VK92_XENNA|nr:putative transcriptional regulator (partial) [Xenorhabdus nematophila ATCC 19061]CCW30804.1 putative transcriptional regulator (partial) [Xenorhabdus nematophila F1]CEE92591.1 putative transcriptional regulator (partial) [Xenorhabdus nematophila str. Anatoliense]CEF30251.1 putative transcriptional regulator (partial) [Xenorhabdus nematophila str. Websteri]CEK21758.1 putative transcriptional regulator (partial) [Xenorhabdus nematophila AN6/1]